MDTDVGGLLERWVAEGLVSPEQAEAIRGRSALPAGGPVRPDEATGAHPSLAAEALGYLGGVLVLVAAGALSAQLWGDLPTAGRLGLVGAAAVVLLGAGAAVPRPHRPTAGRLRAVLWLLGTAATALLLALAGDELGGWQDEDLVLLAGSGTALLAGALWRVGGGALLQLALLAALLTTAGSAAAQLGSEEGTVPGTAVWGTALAWTALAWGGVLPGRRTALLAGALAAIGGALATTAADWGWGLALATVVGVVVAAVAGRDLALLAVGALGALQVLPGLLDRWSADRLAGPVALLLVGAVLIALGVRLALRPDEVRRSGASRPARGATRTSRRVAAGVAASTAGLVLLLGLA